MWGGLSCFPDKVEHFIPPGPKTHPEITFAPVPKLLVNRRCCATSSQISAVSEQVCGQQPTWGYDLKCRKELFYIEEGGGGESREGVGGGWGGVGDYGYAEPRSRGDPQPLV